MKTTRRDVLLAGAVGALAVVGSPFFAWAQGAVGGAGAASQPGKGKRILFFTKSQGFPHEAVTRKPPRADGTPPDTLAWGEKYLKDWATAAGYDVTVSKDGTIFTPENIAKFDAFVFYTTGDLTKPPGAADSDKTPAMTVEAKAAFLKAIEEGKGFVGLHCATDTFHDTSRSREPVKLLVKGTKIDPYGAMIGAEFTSHGSQQQSWVRAASKAFPGLADIQDFQMSEEWYAHTNFLRDLHVIYVQDTTTMKVDARTSQREVQYRGDPYPGTWARMHGKGRVFYSSMGHRQDVWTNPLFAKMLLAALAWSTRVVKGEVKPNFAEACPKLWAANPE